MTQPKQAPKPDGTTARDPATMLEEAKAHNSGARDWRDWKTAAAAEVIKLADQAARMEILSVGLDGDLHIVYALDMPVPCQPRKGKLAVGRRAVFDLVYQEAWRRETPPSVLPMGMLEPFDVFHPNCRPGIIPLRMPGGGFMPMPRAALCLGRIPAGTAPKELVLMGYYALSLQDLVLDELDPAGVLNPDACQFYRDHPEHLPLTQAGLLDPWTAGEGEAA